MQRILFTCFFLSGIAALVYQVIWQRLLTFFVGSDTVGISLIVTVFMVGLGAGSYFGGKWAARTSHAQRLQIFIVAELLIGAFGLISKYLLYDLLYGSVMIDNMIIMALIICCILFLPTFLMGVSLPVLAQTVTTALPDAGKQVGYLYAFNTLGAALGAAIAAWLLIPAIGMEYTLYFAAILNIVCAGGTVLIYQKTKNKAATQTQPPQSGNTEVRASRIWWLLYACSGFVAIALEIFWFRLLGASIKSISITFPTLLSIYLFGLSAGTLAGIVTLKYIRNKTAAYISAQMGIVLYAGLSIICWLYAVEHMGALNFLKEYYSSYEPAMPNTVSRIVIANYFVIPLLIMGIPTFLMGFSFPLLQSIVQRQAGEVGKFVGYLQALNIAGATLGALATTFIAFPIIGSAGILFFLVALGILVWIAGYYIHRRFTWQRVSAIIFLLVILFFLPSQKKLWNTLHGASAFKNVQVEEGSEGVSAIKYISKDTGIVFSHGLGQGAMPYGGTDLHVELGAIPLFIHPSPKDVAIIGLGSGGTLFGIAGRPETQQIVCYEIMPHQFGLLQKDFLLTQFEGTGSLLTDKRIKFIFKDGRHGLLHSDQLFDIIQADALRPTSAFAGNLYSVEYFQLLKSKLKKGGFAVTWAPTERTTQTFLKVFEHSILCGATLIGSNQPIVLDTAAILRNSQNQFSRLHFNKISVDIASGISRALNTISSPQVDMQIEPNTDLFPRDEYFHDAFKKAMNKTPDITRKETHH
ncbi:MAG: fused MFS/spermidine synthase [Chitinophagaceae bacterium]